MPAVSVIIPVYNNEAHVEKCIRSVLNQSFHDLEILVINDGSTDHSGEILQRLGETDSRIRLLDQENAGVAAARNRGLSAAGGEYVTFVDGDDYIAHDYIEHLYESAERQHADMILCGVTFTDETGKVLRTLIPGEYERFRKEEWTFRISGVWSHFYRRELWEKYEIRFCPGERGEDMPVSLFFSAMCSRIGILREAGYYYVQHESSAMHNFRGLGKYRPPYIGLERMIQKISGLGVVNSPAFYELFVLRILATCFFDLGRGASRQNMKELCSYIVRILKTYFPEYTKNQYVSIRTDLEIPFMQKAAVSLLAFLVRTNWIYGVGWLLSKPEKR